jgi:hypothetical protein
LVDDKPIGVALNRNLGNPAAPGEAVEAELNRLIERRSCQKDPDEASSELRAPSRRRWFSCVLRFFGFPDFVTGL